MLRRYHIRLGATTTASRGSSTAGRAGVDGLLPRIDTTGPDEYKVYWGDEALTKMDEAKA